MLLKIMTFNLLCEEAVNPAGSWSTRLPIAMDVLRSGADIIGLQEASVRQLADIARELPDHKMVTGPESGDSRLPRTIRKAAAVIRGRPAHPLAYRGEHCAILYRAERFHAVEGNAFWLSHKPHIPGSVLPGTWHPRVVNWVELRDNANSGRVTVYNVHLDFMPWAPPRSAVILRKRLDACWGNSLQILLGDFNANKNSSAYRHLIQRGTEAIPSLADTWLEAKERVGPDGTYHGGTGRVRWPGRLDRILCRPIAIVERAVTITHHLGRIYPSDHFPVMAELMMA